jgi:hypothetical protein
MNLAHKGCKKYAVAISHDISYKIQNLRNMKADECPEVDISLELLDQLENLNSKIRLKILGCKI